MSQTPRARRRLRLTLEWSVLLVVGTLLGAVLLFLLLREQDQIVAREQEHLRDQARVINDNLGLQLSALDRALVSLREDFGHATDAGAMRQAKHLLDEYVAILPGLSMLALVDGTGRIWASSRSEAVGQDVREQVFFQLARESRDEREVYVSPPVAAERGGYSINIVRVALKNRHFAGVVTAQLTSHYGETALRSVLYARDMRATLQYARGNMFSSVSAQGEAGISDDADRLEVQRPLQVVDLDTVIPLYITVSRDRAAVLASWRAQAGLVGAIYLMLWVGASLGLRYYQRRRVLRERLATERQRADYRLKLSRVALESSADAAFWIRADGRIMDCNQASCDRLGYSREEMLRLTIADVDPAYSAEIWAAHFEELRRLGTIRIESSQRTRAGKMIAIEIVANYVRFGDEEYNCSFARDITERKKNEAEIERLAFYDVLTGLPNRRLLLDRLTLALTQSGQSGRCGALLFLDLDNFKDLNDTLGHDYGDDLLRQTAQRLLTSVRDSDTVARFGGDEFVILIENLAGSAADAATQAQKFARKLLGTLNRPYSLNNALGTEKNAGSKNLGHHVRHVTPSIGIAVFDGRENANTDALMDELLKRADLAMYQAKAAGRNTLSFFDPGMQAAVSARSALEADLRLALEHDELRLYYQPIVDQLGQLTGAECLLRWQHPQRGLVSPAEFIPLAERSGLILSLGLWVVQTACAQLARWSLHPATAHLQLAVNVSAQQLRQSDFVLQVEEALVHAAASPERLTLELTESLLLNDVEDVIAKMSQLKAHGVGFALDDFGTGYSSLSYLKRLPIDKLKIDQSFVRDILDDPDDAAIAKTVLALARSLDLGVVAEGVEARGQLEFLMAHGCRSFQGYLFGKPVPLQEFERLHLHQ